MKMTRIALAATTAALFSASYANACAVDGSGLSILSAAFPAVEALQDESAACGAATERDQEHKDKINAALSANPAVYNAVLGANSTFIEQNIRNE